MKVVNVTRPGGPEALETGAAPDPTPGPREVIIAVEAAGVNRADLLQRAGHYPPPPGAPPWPGLEAAGTITALGTEVGAAARGPADDAVAGWAVGDRVCALLPGGGYAERVAVDASLVLPMPAGTDAVGAAGLVEAACTVVSNLDAAGAHPGETLLVHGGSGGVGSLAIQYATALGMRVLATAGGPERAARCVELGAEAGLDHRGDWAARVKERGGADVILDVAGAANLDANLRSLRTGGRLVVIGLQRGTRGEIDLGRLLSRRLTLLGTTLRSRPLAERAAIVAAVRERVWPLVPGRVSPVIHATVPLERAADAHRLLDSGEVFGKVVLTVGAPDGADAS
ncbi:zinc-binding dehydrogenase [Demequina pelophila]|uniref:zinc-binding dehydrogenase n=1 Tax=Demequina pelophila TaxID=1638984 RepID=UPI0007828139|nr:zinc-binding dehydrogenase [Demequina pelophila]